MPLPLVGAILLEGFNMEKINKCPLCGVHQSIKYSDDLILPIEDAFVVQHESSLRTQKKRGELYKEIDTLKAKAELFDRLVRVCRECFAQGGKAVPMMTIIDAYADKTRGLK